MKTILLVEDSRMVRTLLEKDLTRAGYRVISAGDGELGLQCARQNHPDLILLDMLLPKLTGLDVLRELKINGTTRSVPVIALTGLSKGNAERLKQEGATAFFEKSDRTLQGGSGDLIALIKQVIVNNAQEPGPVSPRK
ncbi:MAG TPA: response regulator [Terriglobales bacterium]|nr:response regulator [Terriglobales bacterium]